MNAQSVGLLLVDHGSSKTVLSRRKAMRFSGWLFQKKNPDQFLARLFCGKLCGEMIYAGTSSILILRPRARAALPRVFKVTEELDASNNRSTAARLVFMRVAISALESSFSLSKRPNCRLIACFSARASTSPRMPCSSRNSRKSLPRCVFFFINFPDIVSFCFSRDRVRLVASSAVS